MKKVLIRIPEELYNKIKKLATKEFRSQNQTYRMILEAFLQERGGLK